MTINDPTAIALSLAGPGLFWACAYLVLARTAPLGAMPGHLRRRVVRASSIAPYVAALCLVVLTGACVEGVGVSL